MQVAVQALRTDVELLSPIGTVAVLHQSEVLEHIQGPIHRRRDRGWIDDTAALEELGTGDVPVAAGERLDHRASLRGPAQATLTEPLPNAGPRFGKGYRARHADSIICPRSRDPGSFVLEGDSRWCPALVGCSLSPSGPTWP